MYYFILLLSSLGLLFGQFLGWIAGDEVKQFKKYLVALQVFSLIWIFTIMPESYLVIMCFIIFLLFYIRGLQRVIFQLLPFLLWLSYPMTTFPLVASLIFVYGLPEGSISKDNAYVTIFLYLAFGVVLSLL